MEPSRRGRKRPHASTGVIIPIIAAILITSLAACNGEKHKSGTITQRKSLEGGSSLFDPAQFSAAARPMFPAVDTTDSTFRKRGPQDVATGMRLAYGLNAYNPLWISGEGITAAAQQLLTDLDSLRWDGLDPERYGLKALQSQFVALKGAGKNDNALAQCLAFDTACTHSYLQASRDLLMGRIRPRTADSLWFHGNDTVWSAPRLLAAAAQRGDNTAPLLATWRSSYPTYRVLQAEYKHYHTLAADDRSYARSYERLQVSGSEREVELLIRRSIPWISTPSNDSITPQARLIRQYQEYWGMTPNGKTDSTTIALLRLPSDTIALLIAANMERLRWLPQDPESRYVLVNIPMMELVFREEGSDAFRMRVVVGRPSRQTPCIGANMANVVFNPPWGVPPTILKKDVLPGISRSGGSYLARKGLKAYDRRGKVVSASVVTASNYRNYNFRQAPGARNALGEVKFNLPNPWDIYLHDTPHREDFPRRNRALSSGCVRVQKPREFAEFILRDIEERERFTPDYIDTLIQTRQTKFENLKTKIPVHLVYLTAYEDSTGQHARFVADVYKRDRKLMAALRN